MVLSSIISISANWCLFCKKWENYFHRFATFLNSRICFENLYFHSPTFIILMMLSKTKFIHVVIAHTACRELARQLYVTVFLAIMTIMTSNNNNNDNNGNNDHKQSDNNDNNDPQAVWQLWQRWQQWQQTFWQLYMKKTIMRRVINEMYNQSEPWVFGENKKRWFISPFIALLKCSAQEKRILFIKKSSSLFLLCW